MIKHKSGAGWFDRMNRKEDSAHYKKYEVFSSKLSAREACSYNSVKETLISLALCISIKIL